MASAATRFDLSRAGNGPALVFSLLALAGCGGNSIFRSAVPAPTGLVAQPSSTSLSVQLHWNAESAATGGFEIWRSEGGTASQIAASLATSYDDTDAPAGEKLSYTVRAIDGAGAGADSNVATALTIPSAPTRLAAGTLSRTSISISWTEAVGADGADRIVYVDSASNAYGGIASGTNFTADNLQPGTAYLFKVSAHNATGSGPGATLQVSTLFTGPGGGSGSGSAGGSAGGAAGSSGGSAGGSAGGDTGGSAGGNAGGSAGGDAGGGAGGSSGSSGGGSGGGDSGGGSAGGSGPVLTTDPFQPSGNTVGALQCSACNYNNDCILGALCVGSSESGAFDGSCEVGCDPANTITVPLTSTILDIDCVTALCLSDITSLSLISAVTDCKVNFAVCQPIEGTTLSYCDPVAACVRPSLETK